LRGEGGFMFFFFFSAKFCPEFNIRLYDKNSESDYYFFPPPKSEYFFSATLGIRLLKKKKKHKPPLPPQVKWSFPKYIGQSKKKCFKFSRESDSQCCWKKIFWFWWRKKIIIWFRVFVI
jgi:hypothetical protein